MADTSPNLVHSLSGKETRQPGKKVSYLSFFIILLVAILLGGGAGYLASAAGIKSGTTAAVSGTNALGGSANGKTAGVKDTKTFPDQVQGTLREGGIDGEGSFHLERPGGDSQNVYLTSSTVDLAPFIGSKIHVWGKTFQGDKAGWLMDVGYVEKL